MKVGKFFAIALLGSGLVFTSCSNDSNKAEVDNAPGTENADNPSVEESNLVIDVARSSVMWKGTMLGMYSHEGSINLTEASLTMSGEEIVGGQFTVDMNSIHPTDENYSEENTSAKLVGHLGSPEFFDVANHNYASFKITGMEGADLKGDLTVRGNTHSELVKNVKMSHEGDKTILTGTLTFDRVKYGVEYTAAKEMVLSNDVELNIMLTATK